MELNQLATFQTVARTLSFTRAAAALNYAQSTVSAQVQALEEELGVPLFNRLGKRVSLTENGQRLLEYADKLLNLAEEARTVVSGQDGFSGVLTISAPETLCTYRLMEVLRRFRAQFPRVQLVIGYDVHADIVNDLTRGLIDLAFVIGEPVEAANLTVESLITEPLLPVAPPDHPLARLARVVPADLRYEPVLLTENGCTYRTLFERSLAAAGVKLTSTLEFHSVEVIKQSAMAGLGLAVLPAITVSAEITRGQLVCLPWAGPALEVVTQVMWHKDRWLSPVLSQFLSLTRELLKEAEPVASGLDIRR